MTQAGHYGRLVTKIDIVVDQKTRKILNTEANNYVTVSGTVAKDANKQAVPLPEGYTLLPKDPAIDKLVQRYAKLAAKQANVVVANMLGFLDRKQNTAGESTLGDVVADAYLAATSNSTYGDNAAQIAFVNPGGMRNDLTASLKVTNGHLYSVHPFVNNMVTMNLSGAQIRRLLEQQWESPQPAGGRVLGVSSGFAYAWDASEREGAAPGQGNRVLADSMKLNGVLIDPVKIYRVTANSFLAAGGDNFTVFTEGKKVQDGAVDLDVLTNYFRAQQPLAPPVLDRIKRLN
jgi:5'-nucleotidase